ncbi:hypothetical protein Ahy_A09g041444 isoform A [Arachis hypogaea]|uniref:Protein kinase domain-containing protein n=1 Tax=Arachis hypogaea TaxID=3818 RepID=A0A445BCT7_ARAHY|nr:hypothetical protein Ahy_A09g041444 isoform A [Arachis hypogaea]
MLGLDTQNFTSSAKKLQDENSNLKEACKANQDEKAFLLQRLEIMEQLLEKNAVMEISLLNLNAELEAVRKKFRIRSLGAACRVAVSARVVVVGSGLLLARLLFSGAHRSYGASSAAHTLILTQHTQTQKREEIRGRRKGKKERTTPSRAPPPSPLSSSASERESSRMRGNAMEERKRRCSVAAETPPPLLGLVSVVVLPPSGFCAPAEELEGRKRMDFKGVYDFDSDDELQWLIEIQKISIFNFAVYLLLFFSKSLIKQSRNRINVIRRKRNSAKKFLKQDTIDLLANHLQAVHLIQGINEQKASEREKILMNQVHQFLLCTYVLSLIYSVMSLIRFIVSFVAAMPSGSLATTRKVSTWPPFSQRIKQTVMLHFYSANLMRDASLNDRVELRILGDVGAKILVINFDTPGVQLTNLAMVASSYSLHLGRDGERMRVAEAGETVLVGLPPFNAEHPQTIFDNILNRKIPWPAVPEEMSPEAQDLIDRLLTEDPNQRLGARGASEDNNED